jgi:hypothetical protein
MFEYSRYFSYIFFKKFSPMFSMAVLITFAAALGSALGLALNSPSAMVFSFGLKFLETSISRMKNRSVSSFLR